MPDARPDSTHVTTPPPPQRPPQRTFRFLEVLVALSILLTLAGMLVPYTERVGERTNLANATEDLAAIASNLSSVTGARTSWLRGPGELPSGCPPELTAQSAPLDRLSLPQSLDREQRAVLLLALKPDPWGSAYLIHLDGQGQGTDGSLVVSAGPDRTLHTADDLQQPID